MTINWNNYSTEVKIVIRKHKGQCQECRNMFFDTETKDLFIEYEGKGNNTTEKIKGSLCDLHSQAWLKVSASKFIDDIGNMGGEKLDVNPQAKVVDDPNSLPHERSSNFRGGGDKKKEKTPNELMNESLEGIGKTK